MREEKRIRGENFGVLGWRSPIPLCSNVTSSLGPLSATLPQNTNATHLGRPCLPRLVDFSPESSNILYHLLIDFVVYLLSSTGQGFLPVLFTSAPAARYPGTINIC